MIAQLFAGSLQGHGEVLLVRLGEHFLQSQLIDQQDVFEHEHQVADGFGDISVLLFDVIDDLPAGG